eukprot:Protomagalhaensia_wolfi_Nauph_80__2482@NODE_264_length_3021_cov_30_364856_g197_i0_p5_GENE_NODE_264_length_3021_cov_30_364856_g197_i0NODE_264_length_3021_cov_30_364856_g197_i0_p5_ORF_typecomplete_len103_score4_55_NODE_264_length_3021_cov_30_364856_g197_i026332941
MKKRSHDHTSPVQIFIEARIYTYGRDRTLYLAVSRLASAGITHKADCSSTFPSSSSPIVLFPISVVKVANLGLGAILASIMFLFPLINAILATEEDGFLTVE